MKVSKKKILTSKVAQLSKRLKPSLKIDPSDKESDNWYLVYEKLLINFNTSLFDFIIKTYWTFFSSS